MPAIIQPAASSQDLKFICVHEPYLNHSTDVASKPEFAGRLATYNMDDDDPNVDWNDKGNVTDWFSFDFDLAELQTLRKRQTNDFRNPEFDWQESVVTLEELVGIVKGEGEVQGRAIGIYPEIKHPHAINRILHSDAVTTLRQLFFLRLKKNLIQLLTTFHQNNKKKMRELLIFKVLTPKKWPLGVDFFENIFLNLKAVLKNILHVKGSEVILDFKGTF